MIIYILDTVIELQSLSVGTFNHGMGAGRITDLQISLNSTKCSGRLFEALEPQQILLGLAKFSKRESKGIYIFQT